MTSMNLVHPLYVDPATRVRRLIENRPVTVGDLDAIPMYSPNVTPNVTIAGNAEANQFHIAVGVKIKKSLSITFNGGGNTVYIAPGASITAVKLIFKSNDSIIVIGPRCRVNQGTLQVSDRGTAIVFGAGVTLESGIMIAQEDDAHITLGDDCMISNNIFFRTSDSHSILDLATGERINFAKSIHLANHVWVGNSARIGKGVSVGAGTVIAQCALLVSDAETNSVYGGVPARQIKKGVTWVRELIHPC